MIIGRQASETLSLASFLQDLNALLVRKLTIYLQQIQVSYFFRFSITHIVRLPKKNMLSPYTRRYPS